MAKKGKDPAFLFYSNDFISGTYTMSNEQIGMYIRALAISHTKGGKLTEKEIKRIIDDEEVLDKFKIDDEGYYYNERLLDEIEYRRDKAKVNRENGSKGGNPNFKKGKTNPYYDNPKDNQTVMLIDNRKDNQKINITLENENEDVNTNKDLNKNVFKDDLKEVIDYLNLKLNTKYRYTSNTSKEHIIPRFKEGFTVEDMKSVIDCKYDEWIGTDMAKHLNPTTLFRPSNFERYLNQDELEKNGVKIKPKQNGFKTEQQKRDERKAEQFRLLAKELENEEE